MTALNSIVICGAGLAGTLAAAALSRLLPGNIDITLVETKDAAREDLFYGTVTTPASYDFLRMIGVSEPELLLGTNTSFSLGTKFENWGPRERSWTQSFHVPLPVIEGVEFQHYVTRLHTAKSTYSLEQYIMSVQAANKGVFAHPPEGKNIPLAALEYGYHFMPEIWTRFILEGLSEGRVKRLTSEIETVKTHGETVTSITLSNGQTLRPGLVIDALGAGSKIATALSRSYKSTHDLCAVETTEPQERIGAPFRSLTKISGGWQALTSLQGELHRLTVFDPATLESALDISAAKLPLGRSTSPWQGNCLSLGHSAATLEPLTPAPLLLLQRDIERLAELIPVTPDMSVEAREYNRRFKDDYDHAEIFHDALAVKTDTLHPKLANKITQFESRGILVQYDLEPFSPQDWAMLHCGMGRIPERYDTLAERMPEAQAAKMLGQIIEANKAMAANMPPHDVYMTGLLKYLKSKYG